ncbi:MAG: lipid-A-disaccharide synthase [Candidatus Krumholzibacteria bacterium]|nr:lipid-A-disaccharide synthase [Candidatus Krumholzibacteria bacterium]
MRTILVTCGETSGDEHASLLVRKILSIDPDCRVIAMGGEKLREAGAEVVFPLEQFAFMGFAEIISGIPRIISLERKLKKILGEEGVDLYIPVDYPGMNLRIAGYAKARGVPVLYYISPQVWAWGGWRIRRIRKSVDLMAVILPFEEKFYRDRDIPVYCAGHPMLDEIPSPGGPKRLPENDGEIRIVLYPGSRRQEMERVFPAILGAVRIIASKIPEARFVLGLAPIFEESEIDIPPELSGRITISRDGAAELENATLAIATSGTVTLQSALSGTPVVVVYRTSGFTYTLGKMLVRIPHIAMPNVLAGKEIVPELIQHEVTPERIAEKVFSLLKDFRTYSDTSREQLALRDLLYKENGLEILAQKALDLCSDRRPGT